MTISISLSYGDYYIIWLKCSQECIQCPIICTMMRKFKQIYLISFILALGIDKGADGCQFTFAPADMASGEGEVYRAEGRTLASAVAEVDTKISRKTDLGQLKTIIFSQDILENRTALQSLLQEM